MKNVKRKVLIAMSMVIMLCNLAYANESSKGVASGSTQETTTTSLDDADNDKPHKKKKSAKKTKKSKKAKKQ